jgi:hydrogenase maturation protein HypF
MKRVGIEITGMVQGVGFRPFVYNLAGRHSVRGWVVNNERGVLIDAESEDGNLESFIRDIGNLAPPLARIETLEVKYLDPLSYENFEIRKSEDAADKLALISPDVATCDQCLSELFSPQDFRYRYPFINCTLCGPRFTIIKDIPYDRHRTTMAPFPMCPICKKEYEDATNRRFHAQPNACPACGPSLKLIDRNGAAVPGDPIEGTHDLLMQGCIVAVKGLGGFHLSCDARNVSAVFSLRSRKSREDKPFAVMCRDMDEVVSLCEVSKEEKALLLGRERPIVILKRKNPSTVAPAVAPFRDSLGVMLPYSPIHHLLLQGPLKTLVMTSGNVSDEPIAYENEEALRRLNSIADYFLLHNREIHMRCDDSVIRVFDRNPYVVRRSRGYVPFPVKLAFPLKSILACGGELKNTFCLTRGSYAFMSHHIGDLENLETLRSFEGGIEHLKNLFSIKPEVVAYDLHPDYLSTKYALSLPDVRKIGVQHHHAHIASVMAENGIEGDVIGVSLDGTGFGLDGTIWGGEFLISNLTDFERLAHLQKIPMPGSSMAIKQPWRMAMVYLKEAFGERADTLEIDFVRRRDFLKWDILKRMIDKRLNSPLTSSMGRFFDAVSSLLSIRDKVHYEGQAAVELEMIAEHGVEEAYGFQIQQGEKPWVIDLTDIVRGIVHDLMHRILPSHISGKFHSTIARLILETCIRIRSDKGLNRVALGGGVFQNMLLLSMVFEKLRGSGFEVFIHRQVPTNDGGISLGQAVIAHMRCCQCV